MMMPACLHGSPACLHGSPGGWVHGAGNGPAGNHNKLMVAGHPDFLSPFFDLYRSWFGRGVDRAISYGKDKARQQQDRQPPC